MTQLLIKQKADNKSQITFICKIKILNLKYYFLAAEGAALEATIWVSGSKEIYVPVMHLHKRYILDLAFNNVKPKDRYFVLD